MKKEFKPLSWKVKEFDCNRQTIKDYDVLQYRQDLIKKLKKKCVNKEEFALELRSDFFRQYWSRCEYELIIEITEDERVLLKPWVGCYDEEKATINVTDDTSLDWMNFAKEHIDLQRGRSTAKIDIFDQLTYGDQFEKLVDYCWYTRLKYERDNPKFHEE